MVPDLRRVVKNRRLVHFACGCADDFLERHVGELGAGNKLVEIVDVGFMVLAIVKADCVRGYHRV
jgi:hypothetical protein